MKPDPEFLNHIIIIFLLYYLKASVPLEMTVTREKA